jgi:ABC-2 type transport system permease protein
VVGLFLVESVASASDHEWLGAVSPTRHYDSADVLVRGEFDLLAPVVLLAGTAALLVVAILWFERIDVR